MGAFLYLDGGKELNRENNRSFTSLFPLSILLSSFYNTVLKS